MDSLIAIGSTAALVYGIFAIYRMGYGLGVGDMELVERYHMDLYFESAATILTLITLGKYLETRSKGKTSEAITKLMNLAPKTAMVERDGREVEIPVEEVVVGDIVHVRPGSQRPGRRRHCGGQHFAWISLPSPARAFPWRKMRATVSSPPPSTSPASSKSGRTKVGDDTTLAQIIQLVEDASQLQGADCQAGG